MSTPAELYEALPVDNDTIRLLLLQPAERPEANIQCTLTNAKLSKSSRYEEISYTWGNPSPTRSIYIADRRVNVRKNLCDCLLRVRSARDPSALGRCNLHKPGRPNWERPSDTFDGQDIHDSWKNLFGLVRLQTAVNNFYHMSTNSAQYPIHLLRRLYPSSMQKRGSFGGPTGTGYGSSKNFSWQRSWSSFVVVCKLKKKTSRDSCEIGDGPNGLLW